jgi:hypothetical protein
MSADPLERRNHGFVIGLLSGAVVASASAQDQPHKSLVPDVASPGGDPCRPGWR